MSLHPWFIHPFLSPSPNCLYVWYVIESIKSWKDKRIPLLLYVYVSTGLGAVLPFELFKPGNRAGTQIITLQQQQWKVGAGISFHVTTNGVELLLTVSVNKLLAVGIDKNQSGGECGRLRHHFQTSLFLSVFKQTGRAAFPNFSFLGTRRLRGLVPTARRKFSNSSDAF